MLDLHVQELVNITSSTFCLTLHENILFVNIFCICVKADFT